MDRDRVKKNGRRLERKESKSGRKRKSSEKTRSKQTTPKRKEVHAPIPALFNMISSLPNVFTAVLTSSSTSSASRTSTLTKIASPPASMMRSWVAPRVSSSSLLDSKCELGCRSAQTTRAPSRA